MASPRRAQSLVATVAVAVALATSVVGASSCIIADPPPELPAYSRHRPTIVHGSVNPPVGRIITTWPSSQGFVVPIELIDTNVDFEWNVFVDYDPFTRPQATLGDRVQRDPGSADAGIRLVAFTLDAPDPGFCHTIEFIVANSFVGASSHTPDSTGGDTVTWIYNPSGDPRGCPTYDAGAVDGAFSDAPADTGSDGFIVPDK